MASPLHLLSSFCQRTMALVCRLMLDLAELKSKKSVIAGNNEKDKKNKSTLGEQIKHLHKVRSCINCTSNRWCGVLCVVVIV